MDYELLLTAPSGGETRDFAQLVQTMSWSGSVRQTARELSATLAVPRDGSVTPPALREGAYLTLRRAGETVFTGPLLTATTSSQDSLVDLSALDRGRFLAGNEGWYSFSGVTPETAAAAIARDYGIPVGALASTGVSVSRKFPGVALDKIIRTLYGLAGEQSGKRYLVRFTGDGALEVVEKPSSASLSIVSTMSVTNTWDITNLQNSVAIRTQEGALVRRVDGILPYPMRTAFFVGADIIRPQTFRVSPVILSVPRHSERPPVSSWAPPCVILSVPLVSS